MMCDGPSFIRDNIKVSSALVPQGKNEYSVSNVCDDDPTTEVVCTPKKLTAKISEIESLSLDDAQRYFCSSLPRKMLGTFYSSACSKHFEMNAFDCECFFSINGESKEPVVFASNMEEKACVKVNGQLNALYPDWEGRDYKKELKELSNTKH